VLASSFWGVRILRHPCCLGRLLHVLKIHHLAARNTILSIPLVVAASTAREASLHKLSSGTATRPEAAEDILVPKKAGRSTVFGVYSSVKDPRATCRLRIHSRPDHCDGRYDSVCDCERSGDCSYRNWKCKNKACNRDYSSITDILNRFGRGELLAYMHEYWKVWC
jgi:hypothetical protein